MIVLGIHDSHDSSACILRDGVLVAASMEERHQRIKGISAYPLQAINAVLMQAGLTRKDIEHVAVATEKLVPTNLHNLVGTFSVADHTRMHEEYFSPQTKGEDFPPLASIFSNYKINGTQPYDLSRVPFASNAELAPGELEAMQDVRREKILEDIGIAENQISFHDHHTSHAWHGYHTAINRKKRTAVVTSDGGGDGVYETVHVVEDGRWECLHRGRTSLIGKIYASVTLQLRMDPHRHLYKVMGLAPYAAEHNKKGPRKVFKDSHWVEGLGFGKDPELTNFYDYFKDRLKLFRFDGIAGGLQDFVEDRLIEWFGNIAEQANTGDFVFAGGVANNTKANLALMNQSFVSSLFVPAGPGDEGLAIGAAYKAYTEELGCDPIKLEENRPQNAYFGHVVSDDDIRNLFDLPAVQEHYEVLDDFDLDVVSQALLDDEVVAICRGGMEFGPRALGARSFIANPSSQIALRNLNDMIKKRDFWMPFAPSVLAERFDDYMVRPNGIEDWCDVAPHFMTLCFNTKDLGRKHLSSAIHAYDSTVRAQWVTEKDNPEYYQIIKNFEAVSGIGAVLNTSLNIHEKPVVLNPTDILNEIVVDKEVPLNFIVAGNRILRRR